MSDEIEVEYAVLVMECNCYRKALEEIVALYYKEDQTYVENQMVDVAEKALEEGNEQK
jgi:hypothetical protein